MEATAFRDEVERAGCVMALGSLLGDVALWHLVLWWAAATRPCPNVEATTWGALWQWLQCSKMEAGQGGHVLVNGEL